MRHIAMMLLAVIVLLNQAAPAGPPVAGRVDTFADGTAQGWTSGADLTPIATGGPGGADDAYLEVARTAFPFHIGLAHDAAWAGDYLGAGVRAIEMDVNSFSFGGATVLSLRLMLIGPGGNFSTITPLTVPTGGGWQHLSFHLTPSHLVHVTGSIAANAPDGPGILSDTLANLQTIVIRHDPAPTPKPPGTHPEHVFATMGIDNITAVLGPAPSYDVAWTFDHLLTQSYLLDSFEPAGVPLGTPGVEDPTLLLRLGGRYQVTIIDPGLHPLQVIAKGATAADDDVLLSMNSAGSLEGDPDIAWVDDGAGTVSFTVTPLLLDTMGLGGKRPGYRCGVHTAAMRGDFDICAAPPAGDLNGDCATDLLDVGVLSGDWLTENIAP